MRTKIQREVRTLHFHQENCIDEHHHAQCPLRAVGRPRTVYRARNRLKPLSKWARAHPLLPPPAAAAVDFHVEADYVEAP